MDMLNDFLTTNDSPSWVLKKIMVPINAVVLITYSDHNCRVSEGLIK